MMTDPKTKHKQDEFHYRAPDPTTHEFLPGETVYSLPHIEAIDLGLYQRKEVSNVDNDGNDSGENSSSRSSKARHYFDMGLRLLLSYQHEMAVKCFLACLSLSPYAALAHGLVALCHSPNYNFKGRAYYESASHLDDVEKDDALCMFPSQQVADRHSLAALQVVEQIKKMHKKTSKQQQQHHQGKGSGGKKGKGSKRFNFKNKGKGVDAAAMETTNSHGNNQCDIENNKGDTTKKPDLISDVEVQLLHCIRILTCHPGIDPDLSEEMVGRPYADALRKVYLQYPKDPEVAYFFAESLVVLNAWQLYEYPSGKALSPDVVEVRTVLETALDLHRDKHAGLCHMYVHLSEMSPTPQQALRACPALRSDFPHAGHLIHMATHIDVLLGDYENCVRYNLKAVRADNHVRSQSPATAGKESFYFGYIVHNYHMAVYGAILGAYKQQATLVAAELTSILTETMFQELPDLTSYLESYSALDLHVLVRFGEWDKILELPAPKDKKLMLYRTGSLYYARGLALANTGRIAEAEKELQYLDGMRGDPEAHYRILHNNTVADLLQVDSTMLKGELLYHQGNREQGLVQLRKAVHLQDTLNYDEPWGKMQPIRHALGGLLLEQGHVNEAEQVFRSDLDLHPKNPWALVGLIRCLKLKKESKDGPCCCSTNGGGGGDGGGNNAEIDQLEQQLKTQQDSPWADFHVQVPCLCCKRPDA